MRQLLILVLACTCCLVATGAQAQDTKPQSATRPTGRVTLEVVSFGRQGPLYTLRPLQVADVKPARYVWLLQEQDAVRPGGRIEAHEATFLSLRSPALREYVSHLPAGARIVEPGAVLPGPAPAGTSGVTSREDLRVFAEFCRNKRVGFVFGVLF